MEDFEKLGAFYLGKAYDVEGDKLQDDIVLYDSKDLTTHAVIIGMTGSGKTGLGIGMLEEAALDHIPVIAIDPKGDLGNLMLTFPDLRAEDFRPWINQREAADKGLTPDAFAEAQAELWSKGLASWGQSGQRIGKLRDSAEFTLYTPGSSAGQPISVLRSFDAPTEALRADDDLYRERVQATATSILSLLGIEADPITSKEHILIANLLEDAWRDGDSLDLASLIGSIQQPPMKRIGVMDIDTFYPAKERFALAMKMNNLLAAPGFDIWMEGEPLSANRLFYTDKGKPRVSIVSIAHLSDAERMFFVSMLLTELISWMRAQPGTSSLRAILYMDEIFGYMPPTAAPPSKNLLLTLLKQARAYGLGLVLATQNPVDLDYKGLSNTGTWFIGRLQTERDKARLMEGLEGAGGGGFFDKQRMEQILAGLGKRRFLLHNVHEDAPIVFNTRWAMSYLAGPFTRGQIQTLMAGHRAPPASPLGEDMPRREKRAATGPVSEGGRRPVLPPDITQYFLPLIARPGRDERVVYVPRLIAAADVAYSSARYKVEEERRFFRAWELEEGPVSVDWDAGEALTGDLDGLDSEAVSGATFGECPDVAAKSKRFSQWQKDLKRWLRSAEPLMLYRSPALKLVSLPPESERDFRIRLQSAAKEKRDVAVEKLRKKYASKANTLEERLRRAQQIIEKETEQSNKKRIDTVISLGTAILGAVLGRKRLGSTSASRVGAAVKNIGGIRKEAGDVKRAQETAEAVQARLSELESQMQRDLDNLEPFDAQVEELEEIVVKAKSIDIHIHFVALGWFPYRRNREGRLTSAWQ